MIFALSTLRCCRRGARGDARGVESPKPGSTTMESTHQPNASISRGGFGVGGDPQHHRFCRVWEVHPGYEGGGIARSGRGRGGAFRGVREGRRAAVVTLIIRAFFVATRAHACIGTCGMTGGMHVHTKKRKIALVSRLVVALQHPTFDDKKNILAKTARADELEQHVFPGGRA